MTAPARAAAAAADPAAPAAPDPATPAPTAAAPAAPAPAAAPTADEIHARLTDWLAEAVLVPDADLTGPLRDLGVDSIDLIRTARRVETAYGVRVQLRELFTPELTTARLAALVAERAARRGGAEAAPPGTAHGPVVLTPSQEQAWEEQTGERGRWNQALLFVTRPGLDGELFAETVRRLVAAHASLRLAVEERPARRPRQRTAALAADGPPAEALGAVLDTVEISELSDADLSAAVALRCELEQRSLDPQAGRVARFVRFDAGPARPGRLLVVVHQLAIDMLSWSVLLADLEEVYTALEAGRDDVRPTEGTTYPEWAEALAAHARTPEAEAEAAWWTEVARTPATLPPDHPVADPRAVNTAATAATHLVEFPAQFTARLHTAARAHRAHPGDLVLHALGEALGERLGAPAVRVDVLRHGREESVGDVHLARTTGWFTTTVPVRLDLAPGTPAERLARTVGHLAALPGGGVGHGALARHGRPRIAAALRAAPPSDVSFDYEGDDADSLPLGSVLTDIAPEPVGDITAPHWTRPHAVEVIATTDDSTLRVEWWYSTALYEPETVRALAARHRAALTALVTALPAAAPTPTSTPAPALEAPTR
ncbi:condensation domain-containing protein [Streptomyces antimicrobicus]|uniref:Condensation domain-containing protein n=1 Tax=Streptomyces antimicrobicus TaxID=2883108 RepID=A0ABS8B2I1_9ACTN|nr:condensation domain-containing protein [Streptomyces antimicrobicus]MCB5178801.1 condensation domain-containing protein [Streptomyces antimicrobicus]